MRVIVVDDDAIVVRSLSTILGAEPDIEVAGTGTSGEEAVSLFSMCEPDVVLMDIQMPGVDGLSAAEKILAANPAARVVFLTTFSDDDYIVRALRLGARGYLIKQDVGTIAPALRSVMAGQSVLEGEVLARAAALSADCVRPQREEPEMRGLTEREREVVRAIADGMSNVEVAAALYMSEGTVRNHISSILAKLGLRNRTQIAVYYYRGARSAPRGRTPTSTQVPAACRAWRRECRRCPRAAPLQVRGGQTGRLRSSLRDTPPRAGAPLRARREDLPDNRRAAGGGRSSPQSSDPQWRCARPLPAIRGCRWCWGQGRWPRPSGRAPHAPAACSSPSR